MNFDESLSFGKAGESKIAQWLIGKGFAVLPVYEKLVDEYKGPQVFTAEGGFVAPDLLAFSKEKVVWVEAKHKNAFSWHRKTQRFVTGIDLSHYEDYLYLEKISPFPVWLLFLHEGGKAKNSPHSPSGLFGNSLRYLHRHENHRHENWGKTGMVYWAIKDLREFKDV